MNASRRFTSAIVRSRGNISRAASSLRSGNTYSTSPVAGYSEPDALMQPSSRTSLSIMMHLRWLNPVRTHPRGATAVEPYRHRTLAGWASYNVHDRTHLPQQRSGIFVGTNNPHLHANSHILKSHGAPSPQCGLRKIGNSAPKQTASEPASIEGRCPKRLHKPINGGTPATHRKRLTVLTGPYNDTHRHPLVPAGLGLIRFAPPDIQCRHPIRTQKPRNTLAISAPFCTSPVQVETGSRWCCPKPHPLPRHVTHSPQREAGRGGFEPPASHEQTGAG